MAETTEDVQEPTNADENVPSAIEFRLVDKIETIQAKVNNS